MLFLDELPEFDRRVLEVLRQPMESGEVTISRAAQHVDFPARFQLIAAMNPCPCGYLGHASGKCQCTRDAVLRYQQRISGPLLDRIDIHVEVAAMPPDELAKDADGETTAVIASRVAQARARQMTRQRSTNQRMSTHAIERFCKLDAEGVEVLRASMQRFHWSARAYHRVLKVARSIADLHGAKDISADHVQQAIQLRRGLRER